MSETQWRTQWGWGEGGAVPILAESDKTGGLGSQERELRAQVTPQIQEGSPAIEVASAPFPNIGQSLKAERVGQVIGASTREVQAPLPPAYFLTQERERRGLKRISIKRPLESSDNRPDQQMSKPSSSSQCQGQAAHQKMPYCSRPPPTHPNPLTFL